MALTPEEAAQLAYLQAKQTEPDGSDAPPVIVVVEGDEHHEPDADNAAPAPAPAPESEADVEIARAIGQTMVIDAQTEAQLRLMDHEAELRRQEDARLADLMAAEPDADPASLVDAVLGTVEDAVDAVDTPPAPSHPWFRNWSRR